MDHSKFIYGLLILLELFCLQNCGADISLKLQNERRRSRRDYNPSAANPGAGNIIVKEEIYQVQEEFQPPSHGNGYAHPSFDNSHYQIFEVHSHYEAPTNSAGHEANTVGYLPPTAAHEEEIHIHTTSNAHSNSPSSFDDDNLDVSYLAYGPHASQYAAPQSVALTHGGAASFAPSHAQVNSIYQHQQVSNYFPPHAPAQNVQVPPANSVYRAPPYLPPSGQHSPQKHHQAQPQPQQHQQQAHHADQQHHHHHQQHLGQEQTHHQGQQEQQHQQQQHQQQSHHPEQQHHHQHQQHLGQQQTHHQGQQEHQQQHQQQPHHPEQQHHHHHQQHLGQQQSHHQGQQEHHQEQKQPLTPSTYAGPSYLPPKQSPAMQGHVESHTQIQHQNRNQYRAPGYLPPGYDFANPQEQSQEQHNEQLQAPGQLPSGYDFNNPQQQHHAVQEVPNLPMQVYRGPGYLPPNNQEPIPTQPLTSDAPSNAVTANELPDGYDFTKPENAEEAIAELHSLQTQTKMLNQNLAGHDSSTGSSIHNNGVQQQPYRGAPYLPPAPSNTFSNEQHQELQHHQHHHEHHEPTIDIAPVYPDKQMVSYAPTQQDFMAKNVHSASVQPKIRTIQIIKPNAIKTLKVLETLAQDGVKTIKILGPSHGQPTGTPQQIVNVISQQASHDVSQVVKVYGEENQVQQQQPQSSVSNGYLPPPAMNHKGNLARQTYQRRHRFHHH